MAAIAASPPRAIPGDGLLHPVAIVAVALLIANDHFLKAAYPGWLTGKLSDFAGLVFFPLMLVSACELILAAARRPAFAGHHALIVAIAATGLIFVAIKLDPTANEAFSVLLGTLQWLVGLLPGLLLGNAPAHGSPVSVALDPTDLLALPSLAVAYALGQARMAPR